MGNAVAALFCAWAALAAADAPAPCAIRGEVVRPDGTPVAGAKVVAVRVEGYGDSPQAGTPYETQTDSAGRYRFDNLPHRPQENGIATAYAVRVWTADGASRAGSWYVGPGMTPRPEVVELKPAGALAGVAKDGRGRPLAGAKVYPHERREDGELWDELWSSVQGTTTDGEGRFRLEGLLADDWRLCVVAEGHATAVTGFYPIGTEDIEIPLRSGFRVEGRVVSMDGSENISGAEVRLASLDVYRNTRRAKADAKGRFVFEAVTPGHYVAALHHDEYVALELPEVEVVESAGTTELEISALRGSRICGRVTEAGTGASLARIRVEATPKDVYHPVLGYDHVQVKTLTDADGRYSLRGALPRDHSVRVYAGDHLQPFTEFFRWAHPRFSVEAKGIDFVLSKGATVSGTVLDEKGQPAAGAVVNAWIRSQGAYGSTSVKPDGTFAMEGLPPMGELHLAAEAEGAKSDPLVIDVGQDVRGLAFTLHPATASISGFVKNSEGRPRSDAEVSATFPDNSGGTGEVGRGGFFKIPELLPGTYRVGVNRRHGGIGPTLMEVTLKAGEARNDLVLTYDAVGADQPDNAAAVQPDPHMSHRISVAGQVTDTEGRPVAGAHVTNAYGYESAVTDAEGRYKLLILGPPQGLWVHREGYAPFLTLQGNGETLGTRESPEVVAFDAVLMPPGRVEGQVVDVETSQPVPAFALRLTNSIVPARYTVGEDGRFVLEDLPAGQVDFEVRAKGYSTQQRAVNVTLGETTKDLVVRLARSRGVTGTVRDMAGQPLLGAEVYSAWFRDDGTLFRVGDLVAVSGAEGRFAVESLPADAQGIHVRCPDFVEATYSLREGPIEAALLRAAVISGRVTVGGKPAPMPLEVVWGEESKESVSADGVGLFRMAVQKEGKANLWIGMPDTFGQDPAKFGGAAYDPNVEHRFEREIEVDREKSLELNPSLPALNASLEAAFNASGNTPRHITVTYRSEEVNGLREYCKKEIYLKEEVRLEHLAAGNGTLTLEPEGMSPVSIPVTLKAGETTKLESVLTPAVSPVGNPL